MKFDSGFMTGIISKIIGKVTKKKFGHSMDISVRSVSIDTEGDKVNAHLEVDAVMTQEEFKKLIFSQFKL